MQTVTIKNLTKKFGSTVAIDNLSLNIEKGKITGLIGADGAGKTTLLRTIIGLLLPSEGKIDVLGFNPETQKNKLNQHIGYMPQKFGLYEDLTVIENLNLYADLKGVNISGNSNFEECNARQKKYGILPMHSDQISTCVAPGCSTLPNKND